MSGTFILTNDLRRKILFKEDERSVTMERLIEKYDLEVKKIHGKDEFEMYRNYIKDVTEERIKKCLNELLTEAEGKDDTKAEDLRNDGALLLLTMTNRLRVCHYSFTESLRYAVYNGTQFALALSNRVITNYRLQKYTNCLKDIEMTLKADCPENVQLEMLYYKARCYEGLGNLSEMKNTVGELLEMANQRSEDTAEEYRKATLDMALKDEIHSEENSNDSSNFSGFKAPTIEENPSFLNASRAVGFKYDKETGYSVIANRDITAGDVLFVEKAFAFAPCISTATNFTTNEEPIRYLTVFCRYCTNPSDNAIPCKNCVTNMYCTENCRDRAWDEYHRWECVGVSQDVFAFNNHGYLALRIIFKAVASGLSMSNLQLKDKPNKYGNKDNNYPFVYNLPTNMDKMNKQLLTIHCATSAFYVQYLKENTDFFSQLKKLPGYSRKPRAELHERIGGLILRHCAQIHCYVMPLKVICRPGTDAEAIDEVCRILMIAMMMCPSSAIMRHSCVPNTAYYFVEDVAVVKATVDIKANEEIFRTYSSVFLPRTGMRFDFAELEERKELLRKFCFVDCKCDICADPMRKERALDAYLCIKCKGPAAKIGLQARVQCFRCSYKFSLSANTLDKEETVRYNILKFRAGGRTVVQDMLDSLKICESIYFPFNKIFLEIYEELCNYYVFQDNAKEYLTCARIEIKLIRERNVSMMEYGVLNYAISLMALTILKKVLPISDSELQEVLNGIEVTLVETEVILMFYYPPYIYFVNKFREIINEIRASRVRSL